MQAAAYRPMTRGGPGAGPSTSGQSRACAETAIATTAPAHTAKAVRFMRAGPITGSPCGRTSLGYLPPPMALPDKQAVRDALRAALAKALEAMAEAARQTREGAVHEESRAEGDKDMRSTEQSYLARGQAMRAEALAE